MEYQKYEKTQITPNVWAITDKGHDYSCPSKCSDGFAFDTETQVYFDGVKVDTRTLALSVNELKNDEKRRRVSNKTWAWQVYDPVNGFFMTNDFETWCEYICKCGHKVGHCYNSTFDFSQIDYELLCKGEGKWKHHEYAQDTEDETDKPVKHAYNKKQPFTYESIHNDMGARYSYKLWFPYRSRDRHKYCHSFELHDFMKLLTGGLDKVLKDLDVTDNQGEQIRKLKMDYQAVNPDELTEEEIDYCMIDVKGLFFGCSKFNAMMLRQSNNECQLTGDNANVMTAGGFAKRELLRSLYPDVKPRFRIKRYQKEHPLSVKQDKFLRDRHLYRGGICLVNPKYKGKLLLARDFGRKMNRYDVNSEYPYAMWSIRDLVGRPFKMRLDEWLSKPNDYKENHKCAYLLTRVEGFVKEGMLGVWYDPFKRKFVDAIEEDQEHLMFEEELDEYANWYDLEFECEWVIVWKCGNRAYAPFVEENYALKAEAKKQGNKTEQGGAKLKLNSSYGKISERVERTLCHYEKSEETGAVHLVTDKVEISEKSMMNVAVGSLITATARVYILSKIREICKDKVSELFVYIDTDSIHAFADYDKADAFTLGGLKLEAECVAVKYLAPKTYVDIEELDENGDIKTFIDKDGKRKITGIELHSKGVSISAVEHVFSKVLEKKGKVTLKDVDEKINYGVKYTILCAMNVVGGKVLLPTDKYLARPDLAPKGLKTSYTNYDGAYIMEA